MSKKLIGRSALVGVGTLCSRILGLVRDMVIANVFGTSATTDAFFLAFKIPNFFRRIFAEGAFSQAFMPVFTGAQQNSKADAAILFKAVLARLLSFVGVLCLIGVIFTPVFSMVFGFGYFTDRENSPRYDIMTDMLRITFPFLWFITFISLASSVLNSYDKFFAPAFSPVLLNISFIVAAVFVAQHYDYSVYVLAWAVVVAGILQSLFMMWELKKIGMLVWPSFKQKHEGTSEIIKLMLPGMFAVSVTQINLLIDSAIATLFTEGNVVSWLYYGLRLSELPLGIIGIAIATVILPVLSKQHIQKDGRSFENTVMWAIRMVLFIGIPAAAALVYLALPMLSTLFLSGKFVYSDVLASSKALTAYACAIPAFMLVKVLVPSFFARKDVKTPVKIAMIAVGVNIVANIIAASIFGWVGLAMATAISAWSNALLLIIVMLKQNMLKPHLNEIKCWLSALFGATAMILGLMWLSPDPLWWGEATKFEQVKTLLMLVVCGILIYVISLMGLGIRFRHLKTS